MNQLADKIAIGEFTSIKTVEVTEPHGMVFTWCVSRERLAMSEVDSQAPHKIMQLFANVFLAFAVLMFSKRFETTPDFVMTG